MGSEDQVLNLMRLLDGGINQAENIEDKLDSYDKILQVTYNYMYSLSQTMIKMDSC